MIDHSFFERRLREEQDLAARAADPAVRAAHRGLAHLYRSLLSAEAPGAQAVQPNVPRAT